MNWRSALERARLVRRPTTPRASLFLIGAQKSGTSTLHHGLAPHPWLQEGHEKEMHFFDNDRNYQKGAAYYRTRFPQRANAIYYESTPRYLFKPQCPARIFAYNPSAKLVVLLRDPIERAYSAWNMYRQLFSNPQSMVFKTAPERDAARARYAMRFYPGGECYGSFESVLREELELIDAGESALDEGPDLIRRGFYADQIERYKQFFACESMLLLSFKKLCEDPVGAFEAVCEFAGLPSLPEIAERSMRPANPGVYEDELRAEDRILLADVFTEQNARLRENHRFAVDW